MYRGGIQNREWGTVVLRRLSLSLLVLGGLVLGGCAARPHIEPEATMASRLESFSERIAARVAAQEQKHNCRIGFAFRDPAMDIAVSHRGDELFHAASTMKVPVMAEVFRQAGEGRFAVGDTIPVSTTFASMIDGSPYECGGSKAVMEYVGKGATILFLTEQMMVVSDNLATNLLIQLLTAQKVTATFRRLGATRSFVLRGVMDEEAYQAGLSNRVTPDDLNALLQSIEEGRAGTPEATAEMKRILLAQEFNDMIPAQLPEGVRVGHKTGSITRIFHDTAIVYAPEGTYYLTILTDGIEAADEAKPMIAALAREIHDEWVALSP